MRNQDSQLIRIIAFSSSVGVGAICGGDGFWCILRKTRARSRSHAPEVIPLHELVPWASMDNGSQLSVKKFVRAPVGQPRPCFLALEKYGFLKGSRDWNRRQATNQLAAAANLI